MLVLVLGAQMALGPAWGQSPLQNPAGQAPAPQDRVSPVVIEDVRLDAHGRLHASIRDRNGAPRAGRTLDVRQPDGFAVSAVTDEQGDAAIPLGRGGVFLVVAGEEARLCRVWTPGAAPPSAKEGVFLVEDSQVMRSQTSTRRTFYDFYERYPVIAYTLTAVAIAVPIAVIAHNDDDDDAS
jgi:hypothetical protein